MVKPHTHKHDGVVAFTSSKNGHQRAPNRIKGNFGFRLIIGRSGVRWSHISEAFYAQRSSPFNLPRYAGFMCLLLRFSAGKRLALEEFGNIHLEEAEHTDRICTTMHAIYWMQTKLVQLFRV